MQLIYPNPISFPLKESYKLDDFKFTKTSWIPIQSHFSSKKDFYHDESKFQKSLSIDPIMFVANPPVFFEYILWIGSQVRISCFLCRNHQASSHHLTGCKISNGLRNRPFAFRRFLETTVNKIHEEWSISTLDRLSARTFILAASLTSVEAWDRSDVEWDGQGKGANKNSIIIFFCWQNAIVHDVSKKTFYNWRWVAYIQLNHRRLHVGSNHWVMWTKNDHHALPSITILDVPEGVIVEAKPRIMRKAYFKSAGL